MIENKYYEKLSKMVEFKNGKPYWSVSDRGRVVGDIAGHATNTQRTIAISIGGIQKHLSASRLVHYIAHHRQPSVNLFHIDGDWDNNSIENLKLGKRVHRNKWMDDLSGDDNIDSAYSDFHHDDLMAFDFGDITLM